MSYLSEIKIDDVLYDIKAKQLEGNVYNEDSVPYNFRTAGGSADIGESMEDTIVGGTIAWNQLCETGDFSTSTGWTAVRGTRTVTNNMLVYTVTELGNGGYGQNRIKYVFNETIPSDHVVMTSIQIMPQHSHDIGATFRNSDSDIVIIYDSANMLTAGVWNLFQGITKVTSECISCWIAFSNSNTDVAVGDVDYFRNAMFVDLTQMFGSTIADYIYSLESATTGAGVAWFKSLFPKSYYAYNAGELMSVNVSSHNTVGFNAFDYSTGEAVLVGGQEYQITGAYTSVSYEDINGDSETLTIDSDGYFTPTNNGTLTVTGGDDSTTCVHLVWSGYRDDEYEEYVKHEYALDESLTLRGITKLDASNNLYYDGDTYEADGTVTRKYGILTSQTASSGDTITLTGCDTSATDIITSVGHLSEVGTLSGTTLTLTTALSSADIVYPLATETTESADAFTSPQVVDDFGTEEYVDYAESQGTRDVAIPVGHVTDYYVNLRDKLQHLPDMASSDGTYLVTQSNRKMSLTTYDGASRLTALEAKIPTPPSTDGTYRLTCTVSDSGDTVVYSWVSA